MPVDDFENWSIEQLQAKLSSFPSGAYQNPEYNLMLDAIQRKSKERDAQTKLHNYKTIRWTLIGGIAAIVAAVFAIAQFSLSLYQLKNEHEPEKPKMQQPTQDNQQPSKNTISSSSSNTDRGNRIISKKTSTYNAPSQKRK